MYRWQVTQRIAEHGIVGIVRGDTAEQARHKSENCLRAGVEVLEVSLTTPDALAVVGTLATEHPDVLIGAGTVLDAPSARQAILAGARFLVAPSLNREVIATGHRHGAAVLPGADSPTEVVSALEAGADAVKLFPASRWSPSSMGDMLAAIPQAPMVPTGGISVEQVPEWISAGAVAVGMGSALSKGDADEASTRIAQLLAGIRSARSSRN